MNWKAWEQRKLGEESDVRDGTHDSPKYIEKGYPLVTSKNLKTYGLDLSDVSFISNEDFELINNRSKVDIGDILFGMIGTIGNPILVNQDDFAIKNVALIKEYQSISNTFLIQLLKSPIFDRYIANENAGGTQKFLSLSKIRSFEFSCPNIKEQKKIGNFFKQLDDTIALQERKLDLLKEQKKGFLQKMFTKKDEKVPEIRFKGFTDDWEQRKLEEIFNILDGDRGKNYPSENDFLNDGPTLFLDTGNVKKNGFYFTKCKYISEEKNNSLRNGELELNDFVLTSRGTLGNIAYYNELVALNFPSVRINSAMLILRPLISNKISNDYMLSVLRGNIIELFMKKNHVGSAQPHITKKDFSKLIVNIPKEFEEQLQIGTFFKQLDEAITLQEREVTELKAMKKSFLQKMFV